MAEGCRLPPEIHLVILEKLAQEGCVDFHTLFNWAMVSKEFASVAIPALYRHYEDSPALVKRRRYDLVDVSDITDKTFTLWRSIVLSCILDNEAPITYMPYALYIRSFGLTPLEYLITSRAALIDARGPSADRLYKSFFAGHMSRFEGNGVVPQESMLRVGDAVTSFVARGPEITGSPAALEVLELTSFLRSPVTWTWVSRIPLLTSLHVPDCEYMPRNLGPIIAEHCPNFRELDIWWGNGSNDLTQIISPLPRNSLQTLELKRPDMLNRLAFTVLSQYHPKSLTTLSICINVEAVNHLWRLQDCVAIKHICLIVENQSASNQVPPSPELVNWLRSCHDLQAFEIENLDNLSILVGFLGCKETRLKKLSIRFSALPDKDIFQTVCCQKELEELAISPLLRDHPLSPNIDLVYHRMLVKWIRDMPTLKSLSIHCIDLDEKDISTISRSLPFLEHLSFRGSVLNLELAPSWYSPRLKSLECFRTRYTFEVIESFIWRIGDLNHRKIHTTCPWEETGVELIPPGKEGRHSGFKLAILAQDQNLRLSRQQEQDLKQLVARELGGTFHIRYLYFGGQY